MTVEIREEPASSLPDYATVPIAFQVRTVLDVSGADGHPADVVLTERAVEPPYGKDYDAHDGERPTDWPRRFDVSRWGFLSAWIGGRRVGGIVVAFDTPGVEMLEGRRDLAVLWDVRVAPEARGRGVGEALFRAAEAWARARGCVELKVETQNVNVPACRFYARQGCTLAAARRGRYPGLPDEVQLLWRKDLPASRDGGALPVRRSARLAIVDDHGRMLLFRYHDEHRAAFWATPGGRLEDGEDYHDAAARELVEETGFAARVGPVVRERESVYAVARDAPARWIERYFLVRCPQAPPVRGGWTDEERATIRAHRWWSVAEMRASGETFLPAWLPDLLAEVLAPGAYDGR